MQKTVRGRCRPNARLPARSRDNYRPKCGRAQGPVQRAASECCCMRVRERDRREHLYIRIHIYTTAFCVYVQLQWRGGARQESRDIMNSCNRGPRKRTTTTTVKLLLQCLEPVCRDFCPWVVQPVDGSSR